MASNKIKRCIVNIAVGDPHSWYPHGSNALRKSLLDNGVECDLLFTKRQYPQYCSPYMDKVKSILDAHEQGYNQILYLDCSIKAIRSLDDIWNWIDTEGHYLYESGYNCAQTSNDQCLENFGITRDTAETFKEAATNVIGINTLELSGQQLINELDMQHITNSIQGRKWPNEEQRLIESIDPRFLFHRQDQTVISIIAGKYKMKLDKVNHFVMRDEYDNQINDTTIFKLKGGIYE